MKRTFGLILVQICVFTMLLGLASGQDSQATDASVDPHFNEVDIDGVRDFDRDNLYSKIKITTNLETNYEPFFGDEVHLGVFIDGERQKWYVDIPQKTNYDKKIILEAKDLPNKTFESKDIAIRLWSPKIIGKKFHDTEEVKISYEPPNKDTPDKKADELTIQGLSTNYVDFHNYYLNKEYWRLRQSKTASQAKSELRPSIGDIKKKIAEKPIEVVLSYKAPAYLVGLKAKAIGETSLKLSAFGIYGYVSEFAKKSKLLLPDGESSRELHSNLERLIDNAEKIAEADSESRKANLIERRKGIIEDTYDTMGPYHEALRNNRKTVEASDLGGTLQKGYRNSRNAFAKLNQVLRSDYRSTISYLNQDPIEKTLPVETGVSLEESIFEFPEKKFRLYDSIDSKEDYAVYEIRPGHKGDSITLQVQEKNLGMTEASVSLEKTQKPIEAVSLKNRDKFVRDSISGDKYYLYVGSNEVGNYVVDIALINQSGWLDLIGQNRLPPESVKKISSKKYGEDDDGDSDGGGDNDDNNGEDDGEGNNNDGSSGGGGDSSGENDNDGGDSREDASGNNDGSNDEGGTEEDGAGDTDDESGEEQKIEKVVLDSENAYTLGKMREIEDSKWKAKRIFFNENIRVKEIHREEEGLAFIFQYPKNAKSKTYSHTKELRDYVYYDGKTYGSFNYADNLRVRAGKAVFEASNGSGGIKVYRGKKSFELPRNLELPDLSDPRDDHVIRSGDLTYFGGNHYYVEEKETSSGSFSLIKALNGDIYTKGEEINFIMNIEDSLVYNVGKRGNATVMRNKTKIGTFYDNPILKEVNNKLAFTARKDRDSKDILYYGDKIYDKYDSYESLVSINGSLAYTARKEIKPGEWERIFVVGGEEREFTDEMKKLVNTRTRRDTNHIEYRKGCSVVRENRNFDEVYCNGSLIANHSNNPKDSQDNRYVKNLFNDDDGVAYTVVDHGPNKPSNLETRQKWFIVRKNW